MRDFSDCIRETPIIVSLRGIDIDEIPMACSTLLDAGLTVLEVIVRDKNNLQGPLDPSKIEILKKVISEFGRDAHIAAGTVTKVQDIDELCKHDVVTYMSPHFSRENVAFATSKKLNFIPGVATVSEAMAAFESGAAGLKLFPSIFYEADDGITKHLSPGFVNYLSNFIPIPIYPSGDFGLNDTAAQYMGANATGLNIGKNLFRPGIEQDDLMKRSQFFVEQIRKKTKYT